MRRLPASIREQVERDVLRYRQACIEVADADARIAALTAPTTAQVSHIGSTTGTPGNPTCSRGIAVAAINARVQRDRAIVAALTPWLRRLHRDDYLLLSLLYAMDEDEPRSLPEAAAGARIPCESPDEMAAVAAHVEALLRAAATALSYRASRGRLAYSAEEAMLRV